VTTARLITAVTGFWCCYVFDPGQNFLGDSRSLGEVPPSSKDA